MSDIYAKIPEELLGEDGVIRVEPNQRVVSKNMRRVLTVLIIILILLMLVACALLYALSRPKKNASVNTGGITWIRSIYAYGADSSQAISPASCAIGARGDSFWVADQGNFRLVEFHWNGTFKRLVTKDSEGRNFNFPSDIAVAKNGWMYVVESTYNHVLVFDNHMNRVKLLEVPNPMSVAVNKDMFVVGARSGFVAFTPEGNLIGYVGQRGSTVALL